MQSAVNMLAYSAFSTLVIITVFCFSGISCKPVVVNADQPDCVQHLESRLDKCLSKFDSQLGFYKNMLTTNAQRDTMASSLCHDYQEALMCVHQVLITCAESRNHLDTVQKRLGGVKEFMTSVCAIGDNSETDTSKTAGHVTPSTPMITKAKTTQLKTVTDKSPSDKRINHSKDRVHHTNSLSDDKDTSITLPSGEKSNNQQTPFAAASKSEKTKTVKDRVTGILDCIKNEQKNIPACVDYYFEKTTTNSAAASLQSLSQILTLLSIAYIMLLW